MSNIIQQLEAEQITKEIPVFYPGDNVVVQVRVKEGERERLQAFEGIVIAKRNRGLNSAFTVRKLSHGEGVERVFQTYSPALLISRLSVAVRYVVPSFTSCVVGRVRQLVSKRSFKLKRSSWRYPALAISSKSSFTRVYTPSSRQYAALPNHWIMFYNNGSVSS